MVYRPSSHDPKPHPRHVTAVSPADGAREGLELAPVTDRADLVTSLEELLGLPGLPSAGHGCATRPR